MRKLKFSDSDLKRIAEAVKEAEKKTSGEIKVAFIRESYDYAKYELFFAVVIGFVYTAVLLLFPTQIDSLIKDMFWGYSPVYTAVFYGISPFVIITLFYLVANFSYIDRLIVSKKVMNRKVHERAMRFFSESAVFNTKERTGILIFLSFLEKRVVLVADSGIASKIPQEKWDGVVNHITDGIKTKKTIKHLIDSIGECGKLLAESDKFPIKPDDSNELEDDVSILES